MYRNSLQVKPEDSKELNTGEVVSGAITGGASDAHLIDAIAQRWVALMHYMEHVLQGLVLHTQVAAKSLDSVIFLRHTQSLLKAHYDEAGSHQKALVLSRLNNAVHAEHHESIMLQLHNFCCAYK